MIHATKRAALPALRLFFPTSSTIIRAVHHTILEHIVEVMRQTTPASYRTHICYARVPVAGLSMNSPDFPRALGVSLARLREYGSDRSLAQEVVAWLQPLLKTEDIDPALQKVLAATVGNAERTMQG